MPISGDDFFYWNFSQGNISLSMILNRYMDMNPRVIAWIITVGFAKSRLFWSITNGMLFSVLFFQIFKISGIKQSVVSIFLVLSTLVFVPNEMKSDTYFWLSGTAYYLLPLVLMLDYLNGLAKIIHDPGDKLSKRYFIYPIIVGFCQFNAIVAMTFSILFVAFYFIFISKKKIQSMKSIYLHIVINIVVLLIVLLAPGNSKRILVDAAWYVDLTFIDKIVLGYRNVLFQTFPNNYAMNFIILIFLTNFLYKKDLITKLRFVEKIVLLLDIMYLVFFSLIILEKHFEIFLFKTRVLSRVMNMNGQYLPVIIWTIYFVLILVNVYIVQRKIKKPDLLFWFSAALISNGSLILSPYIGLRTSIFTNMLLIIYIFRCMNEVNFMSYKKFLLVQLFALITISFWIGDFLKIQEINHDLVLSVQYFKNTEGKESKLLGIVYPNALAVPEAHELLHGDYSSPYDRLLKLYYDIDESTELVRIAHPLTK